MYKYWRVNSDTGKPVGELIHCPKGQEPYIAHSVPFKSMEAAIKYTNLWNSEENKFDFSRCGLTPA